jgi:Rv2258c-like winged HTH domain
MSETAFASPEELTGRIFSSMIGAFDLFAVYLGDQLGFYRSLASDGAATSRELADRTGTAERYAREWLEQQAVAGILAVDDPALGPDKRRYRLPEGYAEVLTDPTSLLAAPRMAQIFVGTVLPIQEVVEAYRTGKGVSFANYGPDLAKGQAGGTLPLFTSLLGQE